MTEREQLSGMKHPSKEELEQHRKHREQNLKLKSIKDPAETRRIEGYRKDDDGNKEFIGVENEDPILTEEDYIREELWRKEPEEKKYSVILEIRNIEKENINQPNFFNPEEEDETRYPRPDELEDYWIKDWLTISIEKETFFPEKGDGILRGAINIIKFGNYYKYSVRRIDTYNYFPGKEFSDVIDCLRWIYEKGFTIRNCGNKKRDKYKREFLKSELNKLIAFYSEVFNNLIEEVK